MAATRRTRGMAGSGTGTGGCVRSPSLARASRTASAHTDAQRAVGPPLSGGERVLQIPRSQLSQPACPRLPGRSDARSAATRHIEGSACTFFRGLTYLTRPRSAKLDAPTIGCEVLFGHDKYEVTSVSVVKVESAGTGAPYCDVGRTVGKSDDQVVIDRFNDVSGGDRHAPIIAASEPTQASIRPSAGCDTDVSPFFSARSETRFCSRALCRDNVEATAEPTVSSRRRQGRATRLTFVPSPCRCSPS